MARSRYGQQDKVDQSHYATYDRRIVSSGLVTDDLLSGVRSFEYVMQGGERLDNLSHRFFNDDSYWWVLALINKIDYPMGIPAGTKINIPYDIKEVFKKIYL